MISQPSAWSMLEVPLPQPKAIKDRDPSCRLDLQCKSLKPAGELPHRQVQFLTSSFRSPSVWIGFSGIPHSCLGRHCSHSIIPMHLWN
ncbi:unnamed protein product [Victoria cruziana]